MTNKRKENILFIAWAAAILATLGSLYFSEIKHYEPCTLCWYQRILMYPFTILLGIAYVRKDFKITLYSMVLSGIGILVSSYHYALQKLPLLAESAGACGRVPCSGQYTNWAGFITIPFLALTAFLIIFTCSYLVWKNVKGDRS
ncbi:MAG: disulfide oxidoreductase [Bacillus sp. (in: firmicutes)]